MSNEKHYCSKCGNEIDLWSAERRNGRWYCSRCIKDFENFEANGWF